MLINETVPAEAAGLPWNSRLEPQQTLGGGTEARIEAKEMEKARLPLRKGFAALPPLPGDSTWIPGTAAASEALAISPELLEGFLCLDPAALTLKCAQGWAEAERSEVEGDSELCLSPEHPLLSSQGEGGGD